MTDAIRTVGIAILGAFLSLIVKESGFRGSKLLSVVIILISSAALLSRIGGLIESIYSFSLSEEIELWVGYVVKIVGASYLFGISSDVCRELGEGSIASIIIAIGRVEIILLSLPAISEVFTLAEELL